MLVSFPTAPMSPFSSKSDKAARGPSPSCLTAQPPKLRPPSDLQTSLFIPPRCGKNLWPGQACAHCPVRARRTRYTCSLLSSPLQSGSLPTPTAVPQAPEQTVLSLFLALPVPAPLP